MQAQQIMVRLLSAIGMAGELKPAGTEIPLDQPEAEDLLRRGKAELIQADEPKADQAAGKAPAKAAKGA
jgi:hypothetical protein